MSNRALKEGFAREASFHPSLGRKAIVHVCERKTNGEASFFAFKNHSHVRDAHCLRVDPCMDILKILPQAAGIVAPFECSGLGRET